MCSVSAVSDYYMQTWPQRFQQNPTPWQSDPEVRRLLLEVVNRLDAIDKRLGDIECHDAAKEAFLRDIGANI